MKLTKHLLSLLVMVALLCCSLNGFAAHGEKKPDKKAILLVSFGTSDPEARKVFDRIDEQTRKSFSGVEVRWAFTSKMIRAKLAKEGKDAKLADFAVGDYIAGAYTKNGDKLTALSIKSGKGEKKKK